MLTRKALDIADERKLDLVEVAATSKPIVCKIMDYGKFKYEKTKKEKEAKKKQKIIVVKEVKFKARIDKHDFETKLNKIQNFLDKEYKVKASLMMFGRERMQHSDLGIKVLEQIVDKFKEETIIEKKYGNNESQKFIMISPKK